MTVEEIDRDLRRRIADVRRRIHRTELLRGLLHVALLALCGALGAAVLGAVIPLGSLARTLLVVLLTGAVIVLAVRRILVPLFQLAGILRGDSDELLAARIGQAFPDLRDRLVNGVQLLTARAADSRLYSNDLVDASLRDLHAACASLDFRETVAVRGVQYPAVSLAAAGLLSIALFILLPSQLWESLSRLWHYNQEYEVPAGFDFVVSPGDLEVVKGEPVRITVRVTGSAPSSFYLRSRREGEMAVEERVLEREAQGLFGYEFSSLKTTTLYQVRAGDLESQEYRLTVLDRPLVRALHLTLRYPAYTRQPPRTLEENIGDVTALRGTRVTLALESSSILSRAEIRFGDGTVLPLSVKGQEASGEFVLVHDDTYQLHLWNERGADNRDPISYTLSVQADAGPSVVIVVPGGPMDVTDKTVVPLLANVKDDFGFTRLQLCYRLIHSKYELPAERFTYSDIPLPSALTTEGMIQYRWELSPLSLVPEDVVQYYLEVFDNDAVNGPKSAVSEMLTLRLPSLDEVLAGVDETHDAILAEMQQTMNQVEQARRDLENLRQDLRKESPKPDWQDEKKAEELGKKYEELQEQVRDAAAMMDRLVSDMRSNDVLSAETLEKYRELQALLEQMDSPELAEALKRLEQSLQQVSVEEMKRALENLAMSEGEFRKNLERTINLLKRIQIEQKLDEMLRRAEDLRRRQDEVREGTEQARNDSSMADMARRQQDLAEAAERLKSELGGLEKAMEEFPGEMPLKEMADARQQLDDAQMEERLRAAARQLEALNPGEAMAEQRRAGEALDEFARKMREVQEALAATQQREILNTMRRIQEDLLELSRRQESLKNVVRAMEPNSGRFREALQDQSQLRQDLGRVTDRLSALSQKTFSVSPEMGRSLGEAFQEMGEGMKSLEQRNGSVASQQLGAAMGSLNETAQQVQAAVNGMMQAGGQGMGMAGLLQRLQGLGDRQQGINRESQGLTPQQAAELGRLAGEQGAVRKSLEQLAREAATSGQSSRILGDLRRIAEEMREVQTDLAQGTLSPETIQKQERILSRLLDSQKSMQERDFEKRRRAEAGTGVVRKSPGSIDLSTQEGKDRLQRDLLRALEEGYARDYQELIKKYFEALRP